MKVLSSTVRFPEEITGGRIITQTFKTYPTYVSKAVVALQGFDYGFSDIEGNFFLCTIDSKAQIITPYEVRVSITFGFRSQEFNKKVDATINYVLLL